MNIFSRQRNIVVSEFSRELLISLMPFVIVSLWLVIVYIVRVSVIQNLDFEVRVTLIPVLLSIIMILIVRSCYPVTLGFTPILTVVLLSGFTYPVACLLIIFSSNTGPNGAFALIYFFMTGGFWLTVGATAATIVGSLLGRLVLKNKDQPPVIE